MATTKTSLQEQAWPALPIKEWEDTRATLHMWTQIVGKVRMELSPHENHWWEVPLYVNASGLITSPIPYAGGIFDVQFDFLAHKLDIFTSSGEHRTMSLAPRAVADFYREFMDHLAGLGISVKFSTLPSEVPNPIRFDLDRTHASYDPEYANRFWRVLVSVDTIFKDFRARFIGKDSPVHFFWGSFDLAVTRFSGRRAPERPGADSITKEGYSHEEISAGFWPGTGPNTEAAFYAYAAPEPDGYPQSLVRPATAFYSTDMKEFFLLYNDVRQAESPREMLLDFLQSTYDAGANLGHWDRAALERQP